MNFSAVAGSLGLPREKWWGKTIYLFLESFRIPYTGVGFRYDLNDNKWHGPTTGRTAFETQTSAAR